MFTEEQQRVASIFRKGFADRKNTPIIIYGMGKNTKGLLELCPEFNFYGVMGRELSSGTWNGIPVRSADEAVSSGACVVIVARTSVVPLIYERLLPLEQKGVKIFRVDGSLLGGSPVGYQNSDLPCWQLTFDSVKEKIKKARFVSFDVFDTLIGRYVLRPWDIYKQNEELSGIPGFCSLRRNAEKTLGITACLDNIYKFMQIEQGFSDGTVSQLKETEWQSELRGIFPKEDTVKLLRYALELNKPVTLLTDTFYSAEEIRKLLIHCGITENIPVITSCEHNCSKEDGSMFRYYLEQTGALPEDCLHIGDNRYADAEAAQAKGILPQMLLNSYQMLESSSAGSLLNCENDQAAHLTLGLFCASRFNSPFALSSDKGQLREDDTYTLGYDFMGPLFYSYICWLSDRLISDGISRMLFSSRDGFLLMRIYQRFRELCPELPEPVYVKTSRRAVAVAAIMTKEDILQTANRVYYGTTGDFFKCRFGITVCEEERGIQWETSSPRALRLIDKYTDDILRAAEQRREAYMKYLRSLGISENKKDGFFDFVASGTVQNAMERLLERRMQGYYFATVNLPNDLFSLGQIKTPFGNITSYGSDSPFAREYLMLESVLTDPNASLEKIADDGTPVYVNNENHMWRDMEKVQNGIYDYAERRLELFGIESGKPVSEDLRTAEKIWELLFNGGCRASDKLMSLFRNEDSFDGTAEYECWKSKA